MKTFNHKFFGWLEAKAYRHINPDGSEGAIVAVSATIAMGLTLRASIEVGPNASIGPRASIGPNASIGPRASIGPNASIGPRASIGDGASIGYGEWWITTGPQGSRDAMLTAIQRPEGLRWWVGCKHNITTGRLREYIAKTHGHNDHAQDYLHVIAFIENHPARLRAEKKAK